MRFMRTPDGVENGGYPVSGAGALGPEQRLMLAVLEDAIVRFQKYAPARDGKEDPRFLEAEQWIMKGDDSWYFSFENLCEALRLDPRYILRGLMLWKKRQLLSGSSENARRLVTRTRLVGCRKVTNPRAA